MDVGDETCDSCSIKHLLRYFTKLKGVGEGVWDVRVRVCVRVRMAALGSLPCDIQLKRQIIYLNCQCLRWCTVVYGGVRHATKENKYLSYSPVYRRTPSCWG